MNLVFTHSRHEAGDVYSLFFTSNPAPIFSAGQFIELTLPSGLKHHFAIASAPSENTMRITTALNWGDFKKELKVLEPGAKVEGRILDHGFAWRESPLPKVFMAQGLDVAIFRAMLAERLSEGKLLDATLMYSAPQDELIFKDELEAWRADHSEFIVHYHIGDRPDVAFISQHCDIQKSLLYLAGESTERHEKLCADLQKHGADQQNIIKAW